MAIEITNPEKLKSFLSVFGCEDVFPIEKIDREKTEKITVCLITIIATLLKGENLSFRKNLYFKNNPNLSGNDMGSMIEYIKKYLKSFNTAVFKFSKSERQTFLFVVENIEEYFENIESFRLKKDKNTFFNDFIFWFDNFIKVFSEKTKGRIEIIDDETEQGEFVEFRSDDVKFRLSPFIIVRKGSVIIFQSIKKEGLLYTDIMQKHSMIINEKKLNISLFLFFLSNMNVENAELLSRYLDNTVKMDLGDIKTALNDYLDERFVKSYEHIKILRSSLKDLPQIIILSMNILEKAGQTDLLKLIVDKFIKEYPGYYQGYEIRGRIYESEKKYKLSIADYEKVLKIIQNRDLSETIKKIKSYIEKGEKRSETALNSKLLIDVLPEIRDNRDFFLPRENEIRQILEILSSESRNNLLLLGDSGVGKSTLIRMLATKNIGNDVPLSLRNKRIKEINFVALLTGTKYRGQFEEKVVKLLDEFKYQNSILLLEDIHLMISQGVARGTSMDLVNILKQFLREGSIQVIATSSYDEFKNSLERDNSFLSYFQKLNVDEMSPERTEKILKEYSKRTMEKEDIVIPDSLLKNITENSRKALPDRRLPDAALLIYERCISKIKLKLSKSDGPVYVAKESDVFEVVADILNLPESVFSISLKERLSGLEENINSEIIGQSGAVRKLVSGIISSKLGFEVNSRRPDGVFLFVGPTGVGKSETALVLAKYLLGSRENVIRIDMSEYMEKFTYSRFVGAAPGYVGYNDATQLTDKIRRNPYSVILLDEIEKADYQLLNIFLQVFDAGRMTDARGNVIDFSHATIIMTSNIGTALYSKRKMGYSRVEDDEGMSGFSLQKALKRFFSPEFLNRIDDIVIFNMLERTDIEKIIDLQLSHAVSKLRKEGKSLYIPGDVKTFLINKGYSREYGARNIARTIKKKILEKIALLSLTEEWKSCNRIECVLSDDIEVKIDSESMMSEVGLSIQRIESVKTQEIDE